MAFVITKALILLYLAKKQLRLITIITLMSQDFHIIDCYSIVVHIVILKIVKTKNSFQLILGNYLVIIILIIVMSSLINFNFTFSIYLI